MYVANFFAFSLLGFLLFFPEVLTDSGASAVGTAFVSAVSAIANGVTFSDGDTRSISANGYNRNAVIEISNHLKVPLHGGRTFLQWGRAKYPPPTHIAKQTREVMMFQKLSDTATGSAGMVTYRIDDPVDPIKVAIIWSIPYNYIHASNWFGLRLLYKGQSVSYKLFEEAWYDPLWTNNRKEVDRDFGYAYAGIPLVIAHNDYVISATMSDYGRSIIKVAIEKMSDEEKFKKFEAK